MYQNGAVGVRSIEAIGRALPELKELHVNNVYTSMNRNIAQKLVDSLTNNGKCLQKLKLSNINLNEESVVTSLMHFITAQSRDLVSLDLSKTNLAPKLLCAISEEL